MPRLARKNIKVFAGSATNNGVFGSLQANNPTTTSDVEQLQSLSAWGEGWNAATETSEELPPLEEIQGVEYVTTYQQAYIMQEGIPEWAATVTYYKGCLAKEVTSTGFRIYNSLTDNNTGNLLSDTSNWKKIIDSDDLYAFDSTVVHDTGNETIAGVKTFSSSPLVPTPLSGDNSQKAANTAFVATGLSTKQDTLVAGKNIVITGNEISSTAGSRNIGEIIQSTIPLSDAGLHLLDGAVISGDGVYGDFYNYIAGIVNTYPNLFVTEAAWQAEVASHGVCGKFVFYEPNRTVRLPKITGITQSSESINALGDYIQAGLPNITATGQIGTRYDQGTPTISGAFTNLRTGGIGSDEPNTTGWLYDLDASNSNSIYGRSSTVQPPAIKVLYYIVVANSAKLDIQVDIDEIVTDLNSKADKSSFQVVNTLPANPDSNTFYFIPE